MRQLGTSTQRLQEADIEGTSNDNSASSASGEASADDKMEFSALGYDCDGDVGWVFGVDFCDDVEYDEDDWYQVWETYGDDYEFEEQIEFQDRSEFDDEIELVDKIGLEEKFELEDKTEFVYDVWHVEDWAELGFGRVEDDDDCTGDVANVFGIGILEDTDFIGNLSHTSDRAPMLDSGSMLHIAPFSYGQAYPLTPDPLARPAKKITGGSVQQFGRRRIMTETQGGRGVSVNNAIWSGSRPILSVPVMVDSGKLVWFGPSGSGVAHGLNLYAVVRACRAGAYLEVKRERGAFVLPTRVVPVYGIEEVDSALPTTASTSASRSSGVHWAPSAQRVAATTLTSTGVVRASRQHGTGTQQQGKM